MSTIYEIGPRFEEEVLKPRGLTGKTSVGDLCDVVGVDQSAQWAELVTGLMGILGQIDLKIESMGESEKARLGQSLGEWVLADILLDLTRYDPMDPNEELVRRKVDRAVVFIQHTQAFAMDTQVRSRIRSEGLSSKLAMMTFLESFDKQYNFQLN